MLTLINTNRMRPPIAPIGLEYVAEAARAARIAVEALDLGLAEDPSVELEHYFRSRRPDLVGLTFRNIDDCFWPGGAWFLPNLESVIAAIRRVCDAPIVLGGVGFSAFAREIVDRTGADFGILGDGEQAVVELVGELRSQRRFDRVDGLVWREDGRICFRRPAWPQDLSLARRRDVLDNATYFGQGGQLGLETKRGCNRQCTYCPEPQIKGSAARLRDPRLVADEVEALLAQGIDVLHLCDSEFNVPVGHAREVCDELIRRRLGQRVRWYAYLAVVPFDDDLAGKMRRAGCVGINFTGDSGSAAMLAAYRQPHRPDDLAETVRLCRKHGITVMVDLLLGGPGETPDTAAESIRFIKRIEPDCAGAALGIRLYPNTAAHAMIAAGGPLEMNPGIHRRYQGPIDLLRPTFFVSPALGRRPAQLIRDLIGDDSRFFPPTDQTPEETRKPSDHNYNENRALVEAIAAGARGAYWDILRQLKG